MKTYLAMSGVGKDRPGLINRISHGITACGGNIELQRSARMAGEFALITLVSIETSVENIPPIIEEFTILSTDEFQANVRRAVDSTEVPSDSVRMGLTAEGANQMGIIETVTLYLFQMNANIEAMNYDVTNASMTGIPMFQMKARVNMPSSVELGDFRKRLIDMEQDLNIVITLEGA